MRKYILILGCIGFLAGCNEKVYDSAYYQANPDKAEEALKKCESGELTGQNCENARSGLDDYKAQKLMDHLEGKDKK